MAEFLRLDEDLLAAAAEASADETNDSGALRAWALALPQRAKDQWLVRAIDDPDPALGAELRRDFRMQHERPRRTGRRIAHARLRI